MEEEGDVDDAFSYTDDEEGTNDDATVKDMLLAEEIGQMKDTIEEIENEDDDGDVNAAAMKNDYIEGLKQGEEQVLGEIMKDAVGNSSMIEEKIQEMETIEKFMEDEDDDGAFEEGKMEVEEGIQIIENACEFVFLQHLLHFSIVIVSSDTYVHHFSSFFCTVEEELVSELNNATAGVGDLGGDLILDPTLTMDLTQYNNETNGTTTNATSKNDEMELVSPEVKEAHSEPSNMDDGPDRDKITELEKSGDDENGADVAPSEGSIDEEGDEDEDGPTKDESTTTAATAASETATESTTSSTTTTATEAAEDETISTGPAPSLPTSKPTMEYVEPTDDSLDPVVNEQKTETEAFEDGKQKPNAAGATGTNDESMEEWEEEVEEEVKKVGGWLSFVFMILMIYTAYQMSENPDGICASLCRLVITVIGCILKILLIPFKYIIGGGRPSGGHYMATPDYRDPYGSRHMELT